MLDLTFFTSNPIKLAHARYASEQLPISIKGFRQRTYHADYNEPRIESRSELLEASYRSALAQAEKAGLSSERHFFFLEDTSVKIDALSTPDKEVPGLDIKYWMKDQTFSSLDASLKKSDQERTASVRSDVVLHIPGYYRRKWLMEDEYIIFTAIEAGRIVSEEQEFSTNLVFPWLDNKTFNKWFVPIGADAPLGSLDIHEANQFDFRGASFRKMFDFFADHNLLRRAPKQAKIRFQSAADFIICGYTCAGKTTASQHMSRFGDYLHVEASDFMHLCFYYRHDVGSGIAISDFAEAALRAKPEIAAEKIAEYLEENASEPVVLSGFRSPKEIEYLRERLALEGRDFQIVFIKAEQELRFKRMQARRRTGDSQNFNTFASKDQQQRRMGLSEIEDSPNVSLWHNNSSIVEFREQVEKNTSLDRSRFAKASQLLKQTKLLNAVKLEDSILVTLLTAWSDDENSPSFTTSEIAKLINGQFPSSPKHKDNVSRYFNQDFYVYYEIEIDEKSGFKRYKLSNTGYGKALRRLRALTQNAAAK